MSELASERSGTVSERIAVVTGAGAGLGEVIVRRLHAGGHAVAVVDVDADAARTVAEELAAAGPPARGYAVDVSDKAALAALYDDVVADLGPVDVLVNNAARTMATPVLRISPEELDAVMRVNFNGTFYACQVFGAAMAERGYGRIVNMASLAGQNGGTATGGHYASSKGAIIAATKVFARDLASYGVTVNAVSPGPLDSPTVRRVLGDRLEESTKAIPVGRLGSMPFIAEMVALLASPEAASVTGATWDANGGLYPR
ncbi:SDR family NAD(P)-dependent oxidoreductase [Nocardioides sp.]|uniref:SDR family NAD(P)-dependent oxidoreductase n=1 Tax=Nocardioides sp. TaxID=35761 RepID=UPI0039E4453D